MLIYNELLISTMKTIKIFLASSEELKPEREMMASLANSLNTIFEKQGIQVIVVEWENLNDSMGVLHKQEEYNEKLRTCDICMTLFWSKFGKYTKEELDTAYQQLKEGKNPQKLYVYFKECEYPSVELQQFRDSFPQKYGHFPTHFSNLDTLKANFLQQFMIYQNEKIIGSNIIDVRNGKITVDGIDYVDLRNLPFVGNNDEYNVLKEEIEELKEWMDEHNSEHPKFTAKQDKLEKLQIRLDNMEHGLWDTALMITKLANTKCSERLHKAMSLFSEGDNKGCNALLSEEDIDNDVEKNIERIEIGNQGKEGLKINIEEYHLKAMSIINTGQYSRENEDEITRLYEKIIKYCAYVCNEDILVEKVHVFIGYLRAIKAFDKGIKVIDSIGYNIKNRAKLLQILYEKSVFLMENNNVDDSITLCIKLLPEYRELYKKRELFPLISLPKLLSDLGSAYLMKYDFSKAFSCLEESIEYFSEINEENNYSCIFTKIRLAEAYISVYRAKDAERILEEVETTIYSNIDFDKNILLRLYTQKILLYNYLLLNVANEKVEQERLKDQILTVVKSVDVLMLDVYDGNKYCVKSHFLDAELDYCIKAMHVLLSLEIDFDINPLIERATLNTIGLSYFGNKDLSSSNRFLLTIYRVIYYSRKNDSFFLNFYIKQSISELKELIDLRSSINKGGLNLLDYLMQCVWTELEMEISIADIEYIIKHSIYPSELEKEKMLFKLEVTKLLQEDFSEEYLIGIKAIQTKYKDKFSFTSSEFAGYFSLVMAEFLNDYVYYVLLEENELELALDYINTAIKIGKPYEYNYIDTKAELLYINSQKEEALELATEVYRRDATFYPDRNEYLYKELMIFDEWKNLFIKE